MHTLNLQPKDILAILTLVCFVYLKAIGVSSELDLSIVFVLSYYFLSKTKDGTPPEGGATL